MELCREVETEIKLNLSNYQLPIVISGVRQVGKTTLVKKIGEEFGDYIYINLEKGSRYAQYFEGDLDIDSIVLNLSLLSGKTITTNTLLIFDEIQAMPRAITSLKYFQEDGRYKILATGSHLGVTMFSSKSSYPVGKIETYNMYPLSFKEFLVAISKESLAENLNNIIATKRIDQAIHNTYLEYFDLYIEVGGYPRVVSELITGDIISAIKIRDSLLVDYKNDLSKYADDKLTTRLQDIYSSISRMLINPNQRFKLTDIDSNGYRRLEQPLHWIVNAHMAIQVFKVETANRPLFAHSNARNFKLLMNDTGLLLSQSGYSNYDLINSNDKIYLGLVIENYIGTILNKYDQNLYYYQKNTAEIDYLLELGNQVIPIEVKAGNNTQAKSLSIYNKKYNPELLIKTSRKTYSEWDNIVSVPLYLFETYIEHLHQEYQTNLYAHIPKI